MLEQLASSYSVLTNDERDLGVCLVDIGGTTDIAVFGGWGYTPHSRYSSSWGLSHKRYSRSVANAYLGAMLKI